MGSSKSYLRLCSEGADRCSLSYLEMRIILGRLLWNFDIVSVDGAPNWNPENEMSRARAFMTWEKPDLILKVVPVKRWQGDIVDQMNTVPGLHFGSK